MWNRTTKCYVIFHDFICLLCSGHGTKSVVARNNLPNNFVYTDFGSVHTANFNQSNKIKKQREKNEPNTIVIIIYLLATDGWIRDTHKLHRRFHQSNKSTQFC